MYRGLVAPPACRRRLFDDFTKTVLTILSTQSSIQQRSSHNSHRCYFYQSHSFTVQSQTMGSELARTANSLLLIRRFIENQEGGGVRCLSNAKKKEEPTKPENEIQVTSKDQDKEVTTRVTSGDQQDPASLRGHRDTPTGGRLSLWGLRWEQDMEDLKNEVGKPAGELSPYRQTSLMMPTLEEVDRSINAIRAEKKKVRRFIHWAIFAAVLVVMGCSARETENFAWVVGTKFAVRFIPPEMAHHMVIYAARWGLLPADTRIDDPHLQVNICGIRFPNPIGLAAGFDKSCDNPNAFLRMGFGFVEVGTVTPFPQEGNPKPRIFRLPEDKGVINRCGFNNVGVETVAHRLRRVSKERWTDDLTRFGVIGMNIGKNKTSNDPVWDYSEAARRVAPYADYLVINVSSPNTPGLRALQRKAELSSIVSGVQKVLDDLMADVERQRVETLAKVRAENPDIKADDATFPFSLPTITGKRPPLFVKTSPDVTEEEMNDIAEVVLEKKVDGLIVSNTTISRPETLHTKDKELVNQLGGLSGSPLKDLSTRVVFEMYKRTGGKVPIIAVGGISSGKDALEKIEAGASAIQIYTAMVYEGPGITRRIKRQLSSLMYSKGYHSLEDAVGAAHRATVAPCPTETGEGVPFHKKPTKFIQPPKFDD